jgi:predicted 2-oxoglutarate/Fe(II)-dependent dioxygenase YbiX
MYVQPEIQIYQIHRAVSQAVCHNYMQQADCAGWCPTNIHELNPLFSRTQAMIPIDTLTLFAAIQHTAPSQLDNMEILSLVEQRTACMRYNEGEFFGLHTDSPFIAQGGAQTKLSLVLYLNDDYMGGETFFPDRALEVKPEIGKILLFSPTLRHMSKPIARGAKYIVRSEVLYQPSTSTRFDGL